MAVCFTGLIFGAISPVEANQSASVSWKPSSNTNAVAYDIYYGVSSGTYTKAISVGNVTNATVSGLIEGATYFFAARALDSSGAESGFSPEVSYTVPSPAASLGSAGSTSGGFSFTVSGVPGYTYVIQASTDLVNWTPVHTNIAPFTFTDASSHGFGRRFYRSVYLR